MKLIFAICVFTFILSNPIPGFAQKTVEMAGVKYVQHTVAKSETVFSICQRYKITQKELLQANPGLTALPEPGSTLKIPAGKVTPEAKMKETKAKAQPPVEEYYYHKVAKGQTIFSIVKQYGITTNDLIRYNSGITNGLVTGQVLKVPVSLTKSGRQDAVESEENVDVSDQNKPVAVAVSPDTEATGNCDTVSGRNTQKYRVGLLLPFYLQGNDQLNSQGIGKAGLPAKISISKQDVTLGSDTTATINGVNIDARAIGFLEFYEGVLLAADSLQRMGMNVELHVYDASNHQMVNDLIQMDEFRDLNLIIGPVYPELQETVASFAAKNRIPMISPLSQAGNFEQNNSWYFKVNPSKEFQIDQTAAYVAGEFAGKNLFLLQMNGNSASAEAQLARLIKEKLAAGGGRSLLREYSFQRQGVNEIKPLLDETGENIFIIPSDNEAQVSVAVTNLSALAEHYNIVLLGTTSLTRLKSISTENYHRIRLRYLSPYFIDYNRPLVRRFVGRYRETFLAEPTQFSFQGFDVSFYFLSALYRYGKDFRNCLPEYPMDMTQMNFHFRRTAPMGGFMNQGLFVTSYERNFDVLNFGTVGVQKQEK